MAIPFRLVQWAGATFATIGGVMALSMVSEAIYAERQPQRQGYAIAVAQPPAAEVQTAETETQQAAAIAPDPAAGGKVFNKCKGCHSVDAALKNGTGPSLYGVVNRPIASIEKFSYSESLKSKSTESWTPQTLDQFLSNVKGFAPKTKMAFSGIANAAERTHLIAYLAQNSATPLAPDQLGLAAAAPAAAAVQPAPTAEAVAAEPAAPTYMDPPPPSAEELQAEASAIEALKAYVRKVDYQRASHHPIHYKPLIEKASNGECLVCHQEVIETKVRDASPAGVKATQALAWYQTVATYQGEQMTFHQRHLTSPYAQTVMNLKCTFCHQGNDLREESPTFTVAPADMTSNNGTEPFTNRKMVNPSETCLRCHGAMPDPVAIMGLPGPWHEARKDLESADAPNGCLSCHADAFRTNRHKVTYLNAASIEDLAKESSDVCFGCHGGRAWYMNAYKYPRTPWPTMDTATIPDWAKDRPTASDARYRLSPPAP